MVQKDVSILWSLPFRIKLTQGIRPGIRIPHEMLDRVNTSFKVRVATLIQHQRAWIGQIINYWAVLARWWCTRKNLDHIKLACPWDSPLKKLQSITFNTKCHLSKMDTSFWTILWNKTFSGFFQHYFLRKPLCLCKVCSIRLTTLLFCIRSKLKLRLATRLQFWKV